MPPLTVFPEVHASWQPSLELLHEWSRLLGAVRRAYTPAQPHWQHISLRLSEDGISMPPVALPETAGQTISLELNLAEAVFSIHTSLNNRQNFSLAGLEAGSFRELFLQATRSFGLSIAPPPATDLPLTHIFQPEPGRQYFHLLRAARVSLEQLSAQRPGMWSPLQLWPHHFDLAQTWFSGRKIAGIDPADEEQADQQMSFGFSPWDQGGLHPYFYATIYPFQDALIHQELPSAGIWNPSGWNGARLDYDALRQSSHPTQSLLEFFLAVFDLGEQALR